MLDSGDTVWSLSFPYLYGGLQCRKTDTKTNNDWCEALRKRKGKLQWKKIKRNGQLGKASLRKWDS